jgi:hypothetical protein
MTSRLSQAFWGALGTFSLIGCIDIGDLEIEPSDAGTEPDSHVLPGDGGWALPDGAPDAEPSETGTEPGVDAGSEDVGSDAGPPLTSCVSDADCDDGDPCTEDTCSIWTTTCSNIGKLDDEIDASLGLDVDDLTAFAANGQFYLSTHRQKTSTKPAETKLYAFDVDGYLIASDSVDYAGIVSGPSSALGMTLGSNGELLTFVMTSIGVMQVESPFAAAPKVASVTLPANYTSGSSRHPMATRTADGAPSAMWIGPGGLWMGNATTKGALAIPGSPSFAQPLAGFGAIWLDGSAKLYASALIGGSVEQSELSTCYPSLKPSGLAASGVGPAWYASAQRANSTSSVVEGTSLRCDGDGCSATSTCSGQSLLSKSISAVVAYEGSISTPGFDRVHVVKAVAADPPKSIELSARYEEIDANGEKSLFHGSFSAAVISKLPGSTAIKAKIVLAHSGGKLFLAWAESGGVVRMRRYGVVCTP